jgi:hypothetical protein
LEYRRLYLCKEVGPDEKGSSFYVLKDSLSLQSRSLHLPMNGIDSDWNESRLRPR